jgi:hypothetical protein
MNSSLQVFFGSTIRLVSAEEEFSNEFSYYMNGLNSAIAYTSSIVGSPVGSSPTIIGPEFSNFPEELNWENPQLTVNLWTRGRSGTGNEFLFTIDSFDNRGNRVSIWRSNGTRAGYLGYSFLIRGSGSQGSGDLRKWKQTNNFSTASWHMVTLTYQSNSMDIYVNGQEASTAGEHPSVNGVSIVDNDTFPAGGKIFKAAPYYYFAYRAPSLHIGYQKSSLSTQVAGVSLGEIDEVSYLNAYWDADKVAEVYNGGVPKDMSDEDGLALYYRFENDITDSSGNGFDPNFSQNVTFTGSVPS